MVAAEVTSTPGVLAHPGVLSRVPPLSRTAAAAAVAPWPPGLVAHATPPPVGLLGALELATAGPADLDAVVALEGLSFARGLALTRKQVRRFLSRPGATIHVVRIDGRIVAEALVLRQRHGRGVSGRIHSVAVDTRVRGRGLGRAVVTSCIDELRRDGIGRVHLEVDASNASAIHLYESLGFVRARELPSYYGPGLHGFKMRLQLRPRRQATPAPLLQAVRP